MSVDVMRAYSWDPPRSRLQTLARRARGGVAAEHADRLGFSAQFLERLDHRLSRAHLHIQKKLVLPRASVDWAALDLQEIQAAAREGFEHGQQRSRKMRKAQGQRQLVAARHRVSGLG